MSRKVSVWSLAAVLSLAAFAGCNDSPTEVVGTVELQAVLSQSSVRPSEPLGWELILTNTSPRTVRLDFSSGCLYNFEVLQGSTVIWSLSAIVLCTDALTSLELQPGESRRTSGTWPGRDLSGNPLPPGEYRARGQALTSPQIASPPVPFQVKN